MLSVEQCRRFLKNYELSDEEIVEIRDALNQLAIVLVDQYSSGRTLATGKNSDGRSATS